MKKDGKVVLLEELVFIFPECVKDNVRLEEK